MQVGKIAQAYISIHTAVTEYTAHTVTVNIDVCKAAIICSKAAELL